MINTSFADTSVTRYPLLSLVRGLSAWKAKDDTVTDMISVDQTN
ncbi:hypothetical protein [Algoriphagus sp. AGSA1]|nr:hypothetical protein [Algoriphagus sp. AGSA1]